MSTVVVDTNVVSYIIRSDTRAVSYHPYLINTERIISFMTLAELQHWSLKRRWKEDRRRKLNQYLERQYEIYYVDAFLCQKWADVIYNSSQIGRTIDANDAWIAATALALDVPLVTHNSKHFSHIKGLSVLTQPDA